MVAQSFMDPPPGTPCDPILDKTIFGQTHNLCAMDSTFAFWIINALATPGQIQLMCDSANCQKLIKSMMDVAPDECVMRQGWYLYQDVLNPIIAKCPNGATVTTTAPVTTPPASIGSNASDRPELTPEPMPEPLFPSTTTRTPTPTPTPTRTSLFISSGESESGMSSGTTIGLIAGCAFGVIFLIALILWCRQRNKRDPNVQKNQHLSYGNVGDFDTVQPSAPTYAPTDYTAAHTPAPLIRKVEATASTSSFESSPPVVHRAGAISMAMVPLFNDPQITAVRIPIDKIQVGTLLSCGGFGEVYRGTYKGDAVAIKKMLPEHRNDPRCVTSFLQEVKLMATLDHPRIVTFIGVAWDSITNVSVLSEFAEGGDLKSLLAGFHAQRRGTGFDATKLHIALHVAHALTYMHSLQPVVLHRDLKSSNVLLTATLEAKLTDFGISRERSDATMTRGVGTSLWMAPEVMLGGRYDEKADVFSFGVVLSELDTNQLPYAALIDLNAPHHSVMREIQNVATGRLTVDFNYSSDPEIVALGRDCVSVDAALRPTAAQALHRIHQVLRR